MTNATLVKEISVDTPNGMGIAAKLSHLVSDQAKTNIRALWATSSNGKGHFSLITDNNQKAVDAIKKEFPDTREHEVIVVSVANSIGKVEEVTNQVSQAGLNIEYLYTTYFEDEPAIVFSTNDNKKALNLFNH